MHDIVTSSWLLTQKLLPSVYCDYQYFGHYVSFYQDFLLIGSPRQSSCMGSDIPGAGGIVLIYKYDKVSSQWVYIQSLSASNNTTGTGIPIPDAFGSVLSVTSVTASNTNNTNNNTNPTSVYMIVGAEYGRSVTNNDGTVGVVYIYTCNNSHNAVPRTEWALDGILVNPMEHSYHVHYGSSVSITSVSSSSSSNDVVIAYVGSYHAVSEDNSRTGVVYYYARDSTLRSNPENIWEYVGKLYPENNPRIYPGISKQYYYGFSIQTLNNWLLISAPLIPIVYANTDVQVSLIAEGIVYMYQIHPIDRTNSSHSGIEHTPVTVFTRTTAMSGQSVLPNTNYIGYGQYMCGYVSNPSMGSESQTDESYSLDIMISAEYGSMLSQGVGSPVTGVVYGYRATVSGYSDPTAISLSWDNYPIDSSPPSTITASNHNKVFWILVTAAVCVVVLIGITVYVYKPLHRCKSLYTNTPPINNVCTHDICDMRESLLIHPNTASTNTTINTNNTTNNTTTNTNNTTTKSKTTFVSTINTWKNKSSTGASAQDTKGDKTLLLPHEDNQIGEELLRGTVVVV